ncbi:MAG: asparagine synthase (glutamine-hydrolyzing) [Nitrospira sp.]|nr:asparagine synthase (glutamine-hydrolyzing) [Nitrospira sp.]
MCGIAGIVGIHGSTDVVRRVQGMMETLARRGPDGKGVERWDTAVLGHRRLAIFDLTGSGAQPMLDPERSVGVVFNGAIYNHRELRKDLEQSGYQFRSQTDTEVLLHGYREWGLEGLVAKLRGMFAFGVWDEKRKRLYLVRDRLGVKPLVFAVKDRAIAFASTAQALQAAGFVTELNDVAIAEYLTLGFVPDSAVIYRGAFKLPAASILEWSEGVFNIHSYWRSPTPSAIAPTSFDEAVERTEQLLLGAVESRLDADVPVGVLLSSGIDSALVCWATAALGRSMTAYTVATPGDIWNESEGAAETAQALGLDHQIVEVAGGGTEDLLHLIAAYSEPFACASALGMLSVARAITSSAKVILTGDGGDDVYLGYPRHRHMLLAQNMARAIPITVRAVWERHRPSFVTPSVLRRAASLMDYAVGGFRPPSSCEMQPRHSRLPVLGHRLVGVRLESCMLPHKNNPAISGLSDLLQYEQRTYFTGEYLTKVDEGCMYYGLEARSPFLDHQVWEFAGGLPFDLRLHRWELKAVLRELARRKIGRAVAERKKRGFGIPVQRWLVRRWASFVRDLLADPLIARYDLVNPDWIREELGLSLGLGAASQILWHAVVLELWLRRHVHTTPSLA